MITIIERFAGGDLRRFASPLALMFERVAFIVIALERSEDHADAPLWEAAYKGARAG